MKKSLDQYINKIKEKTIFIYCNDCYEGNLITPTDNLMVHTLFGNMINFSDVFELEYLEHNIQFEGVTKILLSGHYKCEILNYINNSCTQNLKLNLSNMEFERMNAKRKDDGKKALQRQVIKTNLIDQVNKLSQIKFFKDKLNRSEISIQGIIIDDTHDGGFHPIEEVI